MPQRAEWRILPDEPSGTVGLLRVGARDAWALPEIQGATIAVATASLTLASLTAMLRLMTPLTVLYLMSGVLLALSSLIGLGLFRKLTRRAKGLPRPVNPPRPLPRRVESILPLPLPDGTFPAHLAVRYRGVLTGLDLAAASFVDGWLHVEGRRTSFAARAGEGRAEWRKGTTLRIGFLDGQTVDLWAVSGPDLKPHFRHAATLWIADRDHPKGESILPPLAVHPSLRKVSAFATVVGFTALALGLLDHHYRFGGLSIPIGFLSALGTSAFAFGLHAWLGHDSADRRAKTLAPPLPSPPPCGSSRGRGWGRRKEHRARRLKAPPWMDWRPQWGER